MKYRQLGATGLQISSLCVGTAFRGFLQGLRQEEDSVRTFERAVDAGCTFFDCANFYGLGNCEDLVGRTLKRLGKRHELVITSKVGSRMAPGPNRAGLSRAHIMLEIEDSLRRLQTDYVDVYFLHQPDPETRLDDTLRAMHDIVTQGKARYIGVSNHHLTEVVELLWIAERNGLNPPAVLQYPYSLIQRWQTEQEVAPLCERFGLGLITYSPLAVGMLTGQVRPGREIPADSHWFENEGAEQAMALAEPIVAVVDEVAQELGCTPTQVAIAWLLTNPVLSAPILGPDLPEHIDELFGAVDLELPAEAKARLDAVSQETGPRSLQRMGARPRQRYRRRV